MSECYRIGLSYSDGASGPASVVLKVAAADPSSRQTGLAMGLYECEVRFYTDIAPGLGGLCLGQGRSDSGGVPRCHHAAYDPETGVFDLLLGDATPAVVGDEIRGATLEQATLALTQLGTGTPAPRRSVPGGRRVDEPGVPAQSGTDGGAVRRVRRALFRPDRARAPRRVRAPRRHARRLPGAGGAVRSPTGLVHGDYRLDNMLFGEAGADRPLTVVDWQTVTWVPATTDASYFLGGALPVDRRREHYEDLLRAYHSALESVSPLTLDDVREGVQAEFFGVIMVIVSPMLVERTERGDQMFMAMLERHCQHVIDTDALAILPQPSAQEPCSPTPMTKPRTHRAATRCGARAGTSTSPTSLRTSAGGSDWACPQSGPHVDQRAAVRPRPADRGRARLRGCAARRAHTRPHR